MKARNLILLVIGSLLALLLVGVALAFTPAVQTWAVRKVLGSQPDTRVSVGRVSAGLYGAEIAAVRIEQPGMALQLERASVKYSAGRLLFSGSVELDEVVAQGIELDLRSARPPGPATPGSAPSAPPREQTPSAPSPAPSGEPAAEPFAGVLKSVALPPGFRLGSLSLAGRVLLPEQQSATFAFNGGGVAAGGEARLNWEIAFADASPGAAVRAVRSEGRGAAQLAEDGALRRVSADVTVRMEGDDLPADRLRVDLAVTQEEAAREAFRVRLARVAAAAEEPLLSVEGAFDAQAATVDGSWNLTLQGPAVAALLAGLDLPELAIEGDGTFGAQTREGAFNATGRAQGRMARLSTLSPALAAVDAVSFETAFETRGDASAVRLAKFDLAVGTAEGAPLALVRTLQPVAFLLAEQRLTFENPEADLARVALRSVPLAWAQPFAGSLTIGAGTLSLDLAVGATPDGSRVAVRSEQPLEVRGLDLGGPDGPLAEKLDLVVYPKIDYEAGRLRAELAQLQVALAAGDRVGGVVRAEVADPFSRPVTAFSGDLTGNLVSLHVPHLPVATGPLAFAWAFAGEHDGPTVAVSRTDLAVRRAGDVLLADVKLRTPFRLDLETLAFAEAPGLAADVTLGRVPLAWVDAFVAEVNLAGEVTGGTLEALVASPSELTVNTLAPVAFGDVDFAFAGEPMVRGLDGTVDLRATLRGTTLAYEVRKLSLAQGSAPIATVAATGDLAFGGDALLLTARGELSADAAALRQPVLAPYATLAGGRVTATFDATLADEVRATAAVAARQLVAKAENRALGDMELNATLSLRPDGSGTVSLPLKISAGGRTTDLNIDGTFATKESALAFDGRIAGRQVYVDDLQAFAVVVPASGPAPAPGSPAPGSPPRGAAPGASPGTAGGRPAPTKDTKPFWAGVVGRVDADLKNVAYGPQTTVKDLRGAFVLGETRLALENLEGQMNDKPFKVNGAVTFDARQPKPYALAGAANVTELDLGALLAAADPRTKPAVETKVTAAGRFTGAGANLDDLLQHVQGAFDVKGSGGVLRALGRHGEAVGALSAIAGIIGAARGSATTVATAELASQLNELRFDSVSLKLERGADLDVKLTGLEFLSPTSRVTGSGVIAYREGVPLTKQPLRLQLALAGKGALAQVLNRAGLLDGGQDDREYFTVSRVFSISGTPLVPDSGDLWRFVAEAALRAATAPRAAPESEGTPPAGQPTGAPPR